MAPTADYRAKYTEAGSTYALTRVIAMGTTLYKATEYPQLRDFFQKTAAQDQQQVVLERTALAAASGGDPGKSE